jgi:outer membrane protein TolC
VALARLEEQVAEAKLRGVEGQVAVGALQAFAGLMIARAERVVAEMRVETATGRTAHAQVATNAGLQLGVAAAQARVAGLDARQKLLAAENMVEDASHALAELLALPAGARLELVAPSPLRREERPLGEWLRRALETNPDILEARLQLAQADRGIRAARAEFIPEVGLQVMHIGQSGVPLVPRSSFSAGVQLQWTIWDFGARRQVVGERTALRRQAEANLAMVEGRVRGEVETAHRKLERSWTMVELAREAEEVRGEMARLLRSQASAGFVLAVDEREAATERAQGALERLQAELGYRIAQAELMRLVGDIRF